MAPPLTQPLNLCESATRRSCMAAPPSFGQPSLTLGITGIDAFDLSPDGRTIAIQRVPIESASREIHVVLNWFEELRRLVPAR